MDRSYCIISLGVTNAGIIFFFLKDGPPPEFSPLPPPPAFPTSRPSRPGPPPGPPPGRPGEPPPPRRNGGGEWCRGGVWGGAPRAGRPQAVRRHHSQPRFRR